MTLRECDVAGRVAQGGSNKEITHQLAITEGTVKMHLHQIYRKLSVASRTGLAAIM